MYLTKTKKHTQRALVSAAYIAFGLSPVVNAAIYRHMIMIVSMRLNIAVVSQSIWILGSRWRAGGRNKLQSVQHPLCFLLYLIIVFVSSFGDSRHDLMHAMNAVLHSRIYIWYKLCPAFAASVPRRTAIRITWKRHDDEIVYNIIGGPEQFPKTNNLSVCYHLCYLFNLF